MPRKVLDIKFWYFLTCPVLNIYLTGGLEPVAMPDEVMIFGVGCDITVALLPCIIVTPFTLSIDEPSAVPGSLVITLSLLEESIEIIYNMYTV